MISIKTFFLSFSSHSYLNFVIQTDIYYPLTEHISNLFRRPKILSASYPRITKISIRCQIFGGEFSGWEIVCWDGTGR